MNTIREIKYEESRKRFFEELIKRQEQKIRYWQSPIKEQERAHNEMSEAGEIIAYCRDAIDAIEKQTPKKPKIKVFDDEDEETHKKYKWKFYACPICGEDIALKSYTHCHCGQAIDWSVEE